MKKTKLFLSSTFDQSMISQRDIFRNELRFRLEEKLGLYGIYFYLYDFELGIRKNTKPENVIRTCLRAVAESNMFVGIIGNKYGTPIKTFLKGAEEQEKLKTEYPMLANAIDQNVSVLELEFLYAMNFAHKNRLFLVINGNAGKRDRRINELLSRIQQSGQRCKETDSYSDIKNNVIEWVLSIAHNISGEIKPSALMAYAIRKTKYYVKDKQISDVYKYLESTSRKVLCIYGRQGSGKTVMAARMYLEQYMQGMCFVFAGCDAFTLSDVISMLLKQVYEYYGMPTKTLEDAHSEKEYVQLFQEIMKAVALYPSKCYMILDGVDKIHIMDMFSVNVILPDKLPKNVKMVITTSDKSLVSNKKASYFAHTAINPYQMLKKMLWAEGKRGERKRIETNWFFRKRAEISLEYVYVFITELNSIAKYNTINKILYKQALQAGTLTDLYIVFLKRMLGRFSNKAEYIKSLMFYLICIENGLTEKELELLLGYADREIIAFVYPYLEITGQNRMLIGANEFRNAVCRLWETGERQLRIFRRNIIDICLRDAEEDPVLGRELLHQLSYIQKKELTERILNNVQIVDSITYFNEEYAFDRLQKLSGFEKVLNTWSGIKVTEYNYIYMLTVINMELEQGMLDSAQWHLETMRALLEQNRITQDHAGNIYNHLSVLYAKRLQYSKARRFAKEAIKAGQKAGENVYQICEYKNVLCRVYVNTGHYETAYTLGRRLLNLYGNPFYEDTVNSLRVRITLLNILSKKDSDEEYQKEYMKLMPRIEATFGKTHSEVMDVRILNMYRLIKRGYPELALKQCNNARQMVQYDNKYQMELLLVECDIFYCMRNWEKEVASLKAIEKLLDDAGKKETLAAVPWYEKSMFYYIETGKPKEAVRIGKKVQKLLEQCDESELWRADNFLNMGAAYENIGLNHLSLECYENAIQVLRKQKGVSKVKEAGIYNQIGSCTQNMQLYAKARNAYKEALNILEKCSVDQSELYGVILNNMGQLMQETKHTQEALNYYGMALKCYQEYFPDENMHIANTLDNMGSVFDMKEEYKKAANFHLKGLRYRLMNGGLYTPSTITSLHNLANTWYLAGNLFPAYIAERLAVQCLKRQEISTDDYPVYMCMGEILEHIHLRRAALLYYMQAYHLLNQKKEIVSETAEIYLILATFAEDWEKCPDSVKKLLKANTLLDKKKELYRKDYELKVAVYFSLEKYYYFHGRYKDALGYLDRAEKLMVSKLDRAEYKEILKTISEVRKEITDCMEG